jgi:hypothetical protein
MADAAASPQTEVIDSTTAVASTDVPPAFTGAGGESKKSDAELTRQQLRRDVRYIKGLGSRKVRLEKERLLSVELENKRLLASLNRIYNGGGRRKSVDNGAHVTDPRPVMASYPAPVEIGRATKLAPDNPTGTAARYAAVALASQHALPTTEAAYFGTLTLPYR